MKNVIEIKHKDSIVLFNTKTKEYVISDIVVDESILKNLPIYISDMFSFYKSFTTGSRVGKLTRLRTLKEKNIIEALKKRDLLT